MSLQCQIRDWILKLSLSAASLLCRHTRIWAWDFLEQSDHGVAGVEGGHNPVVAPQACGYHRLSLASVEQLMAEPAQPWMGGLGSAAAQPWTSHLPGTSASQRSQVLAAAGGQCHQKCSSEHGQEGWDSPEHGWKGERRDRKGQETHLGLWSSSCKAKGLRDPSQPGRKQGCRARGMSPTLPSHPIPTLWYPQDVPKGEGHVWAPFSWDTAILLPAHGCFSNDCPTPKTWPLFSWDVTTLLLSWD